jgi:hypothetical protein
MRVSPCSVTILSRLKTDGYATGVERNPEQLYPEQSKRGEEAGCAKKKSYLFIAPDKNYIYLTSVKESRRMPLSSSLTPLFQQDKHNKLPSPSFGPRQQNIKVSLVRFLD